eukprot:COSAG01_NODE_69464_length_261_cov_0.641975_1_plen_86_part_11
MPSPAAARASTSQSTRLADQITEPTQHPPEKKGSISETEKRRGAQPPRRRRLAEVAVDRALQQRRHRRLLGQQHLPRPQQVLAAWP